MGRARPFPSKARKLLILLCHSLLVLGLVSGCEARPKPPIDTSLLTGDPCTPPCWHNIIPGVSDEDNVCGQLENSPFVKQGTLNRRLTEVRGVPLVMFAWSSWQARVEDPNRVYLRDGKVLLIEIKLNYDLTLGEIVNKYGPPASLFATIGVADFFWYEVTFDYPSQGLTLRSFSLVNPEDVADGTVPLSEDMKITAVYYYAPTSLQDALNEVFLLTPDGVKYGVANRQEWQGFVRIKAANRGE